MKNLGMDAIELLEAQLGDKPVVQQRFSVGRDA
jgi:hypothetical protein